MKNAQQADELNDENQETTEESEPHGPENAAGAQPEAAPPTLEERLEALQAQAAENHDLYLRARAELENLRKRAAKERTEALRFGNESILRNLLPVLDGLDRALAAAGEDIVGAAFHEGLQLLANQLLDTLQKEGLEAVAVTPGDLFDPTLHEAISTIPTDQYAENSIVEEITRGYRYKERVLRPSQVVVARAPADSK